MKIANTGRMSQSISSIGISIGIGIGDTTPLALARVLAGLLVAEGYAWLHVH
jgi:hypothetical protein